MSPEQIEGEPLDPRTDIFSLGVVLYEMAAGARPFGGDSSPALMSSILKDRPTPVSERRPDVPAGVSQPHRSVSREAAARSHSVRHRDPGGGEGTTPGVGIGRRARESRRDDAGRSIAVLPFTI